MKESEKERINHQVQEDGRYGRHEERKYAICELQIRHMKIKQVKKCKYLGSSLTGDGKCDTKIRTRIKVAKDAFENLKLVP